MNWTLIKDKNPEITGEYLVSIDYGGANQQTALGEYVKEINSWLVKERLNDKVYAWTEKPEPANKKPDICKKCSFFKEFTKNRYTCSCKDSPYYNYIISQNHSACDEAN